MNHGKATLKQDWHVYKAGSIGTITAFLPDERVFAVSFGPPPQWFTFSDCTLKQFRELFDLELDECCKGYIDDKFDTPRVGVALIVRKWNDKTVLLHKRLSKHAYGTWANPGGHLEKWEDFAECAARELKEEAGEDIKVTYPKFWTCVNTKFEAEDKHYVLIVMVSDWISGEAKVTEPDKCAEWKWFLWDDLPKPLIQGTKILSSDPKMNPFLIEKLYDTITYTKPSV